MLSAPFPPRRRSVANATQLLVMCLLANTAVATAAAAAEPAAIYAQRRESMVADIRQMAAESPLDGRTGIAAPVLDAMRAVPRHLLVPQGYRPFAYENRPLPIGFGQTISQPYIVAIMTDLLNIDGDDVVLEIGTGSGYQAAVLGQLAARVYTVEIVEPLAERARRDLAAIGAHTVTVAHRDGYYGWEAHAPFDAIIVTAAASHIPPPLVRQLKPGGRMVIPVGAQFLTQYLTLVTRNETGQVRTRRLLPVRFVPLTRGE